MTVIVARGSRPAAGGGRWVRVSRRSRHAYVQRGVAAIDRTRADRWWTAGRRTSAHGVDGPGAVRHENGRTPASIIRRPTEAIDSVDAAVIRSTDMTDRTCSRSRSPPAATTATTSRSEIMPTGPIGLLTRSTPISSAANSLATSRSDSCCSTVTGWYFMILRIGCSAAAASSASPIRAPLGVIARLASSRERGVRPAWWNPPRHIRLVHREWSVANHGCSRAARPDGAVPDGPSPPARSAAGTRGRPPPGGDEPECARVDGGGRSFPGSA